MKLTRTLNVTEKEFFDYLEDELISEFVKYSKKGQRPDSIEKGMKYVKNANDKFTKSEVVIQKYKRGEIYAFKYKTYTDTIYVTYLTKVESEDKLTVTFIQDMQKQNHKNRLFKSFSTAFYLGRMSDRLYDIQKRIIDKREGVLQENERYPRFKKLRRKL